MNETKINNNKSKQISLLCDIVINRAHHSNVELGTPLYQQFPTFSDSRTTWQTFSQFTSQHTIFHIFLGKFLMTFYSHFTKKPIFLVISPKFLNFQKFLAIFRDKHRSFHLQSSLTSNTFLNSQLWSQPTTTALYQVCTTILYCTQTICTTVYNWTLISCPGRAISSLLYNKFFSTLYWSLFIKYYQYHYIDIIYQYHKSLFSIIHTQLNTWSWCIKDYTHLLTLSMPLSSKFYHSLEHLKSSKRLRCSKKTVNNWKITKLHPKMW